MLSFFYNIALLLALAGHIFALDIPFQNATFNGNVTVQELFTIPPGPYDTSCASKCPMMQSSIETCQSNDDNCLCSSSTSMAIQYCEQCLFEFFIHTNTVPSDPRLGGSPTVASYVTACNNAGFKNVTATLHVPADWQGLHDDILNTPATVVVVGFGAILGGGLMYIMSNLD